jgi:hypothetical protein
MTVVAALGLQGVRLTRLIAVRSSERAVPDDRKNAFKEFVVRKRFQCSAAKVLERQ